MFDIITFGSATVDVFAETNINDLKEEKKYVGYPIGSKILLKEIKFSIGGGGTNTAVAFARFGLKTGYIGKLDSGFEGKEILELLKKEKIEFLGGIEKDSSVNGGYSIILDSKGNDRTILKYSGANDFLKAPELDMKKIQSRWLYLSTMLGESFKTQEKVAMKMHKNGTKIAFNTTEYQIKAQNIKPLLKICDVFVLNHEEARMLVKEGNVLKGLKNLGPKIVVITNKDQDTLAYDGSKVYSITPHKIKVVERTGAGDAFASGFVAGQIIGKSIDKSLKIGLEESESVIKSRGAKNGLLRKKLGK
jgi:ribokinase